MTVELKYRLQFSTFQSGVRFWRRAGSVCACVLCLACEPPDVSEATHSAAVLAGSCSRELTGSGGQEGARPDQAARHPLTQTDFQKENFTPTTCLNFPRILNSWKIGIKINTTARDLRHLALPRHQAGGCLQKGWPQNVTEIPA